MAPCTSPTAASIPCLPSWRWPSAPPTSSQRAFSLRLPFVVENGVIAEIPPAAFEPLVLAKNALAPHSDPLHNAIGGPVLHGTKGEDAVQSEFLEAELEQSAGGLSGVAFAPISACERIADLSFLVLRNAEGKIATSNQFVVSGKNDSKFVAVSRRTSSEADGSLDTLANRLLARRLRAFVSKNLRVGLVVQRSRPIALFKFSED